MMMATNMRSMVVRVMFPADNSTPATDFPEGDGAGAEWRAFGAGRAAVRPGAANSKNSSGKNRSKNVIV